MSEASPIRERGYRGYLGARTDGRAISVIARHLARLTLRRRGIRFLLIITLIPLSGWSLVLFAQDKLQQMAGMSSSAGAEYLLKLYVQPHGTVLFALLMAALAGAGMIADDRRAGAMQFYFSRALTLEQYLGGKLVTAAILISLVSLVPAIVVGALQLALDKGSAIAGAVALLEGIVFGLFQSLVLSLFAVTASALTKSRGTAQALFAAAIFVPALLGGIVAQSTRTPWPSLLSISHHLQVIAHFIFRVTPQESERLLPAWASIVALVAMSAGSIYVLRARVRTLAGNPS